MNPEVVMEQVLHLHHLLEVPEAAKLRKLDTEMTELAKSKKVNPEQKMRRFEELLAEYRQVLHVLKKKGSSNVLEEESGEVLRNLIKKMVREEQSKLSQQSGAATEVKEEPADARYEGEDVDMTKEEEVDEDVDAGTAAVDTVPVHSTPNMIATRMAATPSLNSSSFETPKYVQQKAAASRSSSKENKSLGKIITSVMKRRGMLINKGGVQIPVPRSSEQKRRRKSTAFYKQVTYDTTLNYLSSRREEKPKGNLGRIIDIVMDTVKDDIDKEMLRNYPNLKRVYDEKFPRLTGSWSTLK